VIGSAMYCTQNAPSHAEALRDSSRKFWKYGATGERTNLCFDAARHEVRIPPEPLERKLSFAGQMEPAEEARGQLRRTRN
jgi:hypothetical protein